MTQPPSQRPHAFDAEERALARALPRLHGRTTPGPDLDAGILAAAQAAVQPARPTQPDTRLRVGWIGPAALAASMVLAVGMAWQLRPLPALDAAPPTTQPDAAQTLSVRVIAPPIDTPVPRVQSTPVPAPSTPTGQEADLPAVSAQQELPPRHDRPVQAPVPMLSSPALAPPAAAPPPPAAMAAAELPPAGTSIDALDTQSSARSMRTPAVPPAAVAIPDKSGVAGKSRLTSAQASPAVPVAPMQTQVSNEAEMATDGGFIDDPLEDIPPATADSPAVRDAWLHRISELLDQGKRQEAKASLAEFRRRYPTAVLPPGLRAFEIAR